MEVDDRVRWQFPESIEHARSIQVKLAGIVERSGRYEKSEIHFIAGVDASISPDKEWMIGVVSLLRWPQLTVEDVSIQTERVAFPYVPGYLSFREVPVLMKAAEQLGVIPDLTIVDGQGLAHPRRLGLACHFGLVMGWTTIGCAKSRLVGQCSEPGEEKGAWTDCIDRGEKIARLVRTRSHVKPVWVSIGHRISLIEAQKWVLLSTSKYRLPDPVRVAHNEAAQFRRSHFA